MGRGCEVERLTPLVDVMQDDQVSQTANSMHGYNRKQNVLIFME